MTTDTVPKDHCGRGYVSPVARPRPSAEWRRARSMLAPVDGHDGGRCAPPTSPRAGGAHAAHCRRRWGTLSTPCRRACQSTNEHVSCYATGPPAGGPRQITRASGRGYARRVCEALTATACADFVAPDGHRAEGADQGLPSTVAGRPQPRERSPPAPRRARWRRASGCRPLDGKDKYWGR